LSVHIRKRKRKDGTYRLYLDIYNRAERQFKDLKLYLIGDSKKDKLTWQIAENKKRNIENEFFFKHTSKSNFSNTDNFLEFFLEIAKTNYKDTTYKDWNTVYKYLYAFSKSHVCFLDINTSWIRIFQNYLLSKVSNNSAYIYMNKLKLSINYARQCGLITENPFESISKIKRENYRFDHLTVDEIQKLIDTNCRNFEVKRAFLFSCFTGVSIDQLRLFIKDDIDLNDRGEYYPWGTYDLEGADFPLCKPARKILELNTSFIKKKSISSNIFKLPSKSTIWRCLEKWKQDAGIKKQLSLKIPIQTFGIYAHALDFTWDDIEYILEEINYNRFYYNYYTKKQRNSIKNKILNINFGRIKIK
jgi:integrase-like protein/Arm domain-containing DNA-binding protein